ncbi:hypothetical protein PMAYCL1PPCAC_08981, partial [Pristionchus mayeri]
YQSGAASPAVQPYFTTTVTQSPLQYASSTHTPSHSAAPLDQSSPISSEVPWSSNNRFLLETSTYGVDSSFFPMKRRRSITVRKFST